MKICVDLTSLADNLSGIERYAACITLEMIKEHEEQYVLVFKREISSLFKDVCKQENIETIVLPECKKLLFNQIRLPNVLRKIKADWFIFLAFPAPVLLFKKNMVETIHDITAWDYPETMNGMSKWYFKLSHLIAIEKCKAIITISNFSKQRINEKLGYPIDKIWLIYCGIDQERFVVDDSKLDEIRKKYHLPQRYLLSLSTLEPRKNLPLLIHAYEELIRENVELPPLVLAGRKGWKMEELLSSIDEKVKNKLYFTGFIDDEDLPEVYGMAEFFVFPSIYEGFGIPPLEAMACGTPILSSDAASLPEVCGDAAVYFESNNLQSLKDALKKIGVMDNTERTRLEYAGRDRIGLFDWGKEANKLFQKLMEI